MSRTTIARLLIENSHHHRRMVTLFNHLKREHRSSVFDSLKQDLLKELDIAIDFYPIVRRQIAAYKPSRFNPRLQRWEVLTPTMVRAERRKAARRSAVWKTRLAERRGAPQDTDGEVVGRVKKPRGRNLTRS